MMTTKLFVIDTSTFVGAVLMKNSIPRQVVEQATNTGKILQSTETITELDEVLRREKFNKYISEEDRMRFLATLLRESILIAVSTEITDCRDPKDNKFLSLAVDGKADCIITSDNDLLVLHPYRNISILTPRTFLDEIGQ